VIGISLLCRGLGRSLGEKVRNDVLCISLGNIETLGYVIGSGDGIWLGDLLVEGLGDTLGRTLAIEVFGSSLLCRRLGRPLGEKVGNEVLGIALGNIETLGYVIGSGDGIWLGELVAEGVWDILGRTLFNVVLGIWLLCCRLGRSLGELVRNDVLGILLGNIETRGYLLGSDDGIWLGELVAEGFCDTLGRVLRNEVLGISLLCRRFGPSISDTAFSPMPVGAREVLGLALVLGQLEPNDPTRVPENMCTVLTEVPTVQHNSWLKTDAP
jgi:hypothetical protein